MHPAALEHLVAIPNGRAFIPASYCEMLFSLKYPEFQLKSMQKYCYICHSVFCGLDLCFPAQQNVAISCIGPKGEPLREVFRLRVELQMELYL